MNLANGRGEISVDRFSVDLERLADRLVQDPATDRLRLHVGGVNAVGERQHGFETVHDRLMIDLQLFALPFSGDSLSSNPLLFLLEQTRRYLVAVVGLKELLLLRPQLLELFCDFDTPWFSSTLRLSDVVLKASTDSVALGSG